jgi:hypothetical protein
VVAIIASARCNRGVYSAALLETAETSYPRSDVIPHPEHVVIGRKALSSGVGNAGTGGRGSTGEQSKGAQWSVVTSQSFAKSARRDAFINRAAHK